MAWEDAAESYRPDDRHRRAAIGEIPLDHAQVLRDGDRRIGGERNEDRGHPPPTRRCPAQARRRGEGPGHRAQDPPPNRERLAAIRGNLDNAPRTIARLRDSRAG